MRAEDPLRFAGPLHVGFLCASLEASLAFYCGVLGLQQSSDRPDAKLPYRGAWLKIGQEMIHLLELPAPGLAVGTPGHDRKAAFGLASIATLEARLKDHGIPCTRSQAGRKAIFFRDPDQNCIECYEAVAPR